MWRTTRAMLPRGLAFKAPLLAGLPALIRSSSYYVPIVVEQTNRGERAYDIYSRCVH